MKSKIDYKTNVLRDEFELEERLPAQFFVATIGAKTKDKIEEEATERVLSQQLVYVDRLTLALAETVRKLIFC